MQNKIAVLLDVTTNDIDMKIYKDERLNDSDQ